MNIPGSRELGSPMHHQILTVVSATFRPSFVGWEAAVVESGVGGGIGCRSWGGHRERTGREEEEVG